MKRIPNYGLYGEIAQPAWRDMLHCEWINERSEQFQWEIKPHQHDALLQLFYIRSGGGEVSLENQRLSFTGPSILVLPSRTVHAFSYHRDTDGPVITAAQRPLESMARIVAPGLLGFLQRPSVVPLPWQADGSEPIWPLIELIQAEARSDARGNLAAGHSLLLTLLIHAARLDASVNTAPRPGKSRRAAVLRQFRELVDKHFRNHWTLGRYSETLGMTTATLGRVCREEAGVAPSAIINERTVREAQRQLAYTSLHIQQIARDLGFADTAYFSRFFRKQAGLKPSEFRGAFKRDD
ncbi:helix-turn-helix domain-containing protein [Pseudomonas stutzeri]|uniref:helix-turn-helix domain-containing protein n=1 Tax=Stutzerimonas stutzeri TaxID=316 RepID=UPI00210E07B8|nr:helix-turn-helix domain-containing protein [Stutzerimonas stutzeri]MCQ4288930.1 helix-turn-helix domain-containing protein [Stutzerimonas stutzeri]